MAKLSEDDVLKLARLARLHLTEDEIVKFSDEIGSILEYVNKLKQVDLSNLEPTMQVTGLTNVTRPDEYKDYGFTPAELMKNAPATEEGHIKVRRMIT